MKPYLVLPRHAIPFFRNLYGTAVDYIEQTEIPILKASQTAKKARRTMKRMKKKPRRRKMKDWEKTRSYCS